MSPAADPTVLVVEDHRLTSDTIAFLLGQRKLTTQTMLGCEFAKTLGAGEPVRARLVLLDLDLGNGLDGATLIPDLVAAGVLVVVCSGEAPHRLGECLEAGATAVVPKSGPPQRAVDAVVRALAGEPAMSPRDRSDLLAALRTHRTEHASCFGGLADLTAGEADVLRSLAEGIAPAAIAASRGVSVKTVRHQIESILLKLGVSSQLQAVSVVHRAGWFQRVS